MNESLTKKSNLKSNLGVLKNLMDSAFNDVIYRTDYRLTTELSQEPPHTIYYKNIFTIK